MDIVLPAILIFVFLLSLLFTYRFSLPTSILYIVDQPNERSLHSMPKPRSGGVAIIISIYCGYLLYFLTNPVIISSILGLLFSVFLVACVSFIDDIRGVPFLYRLIIHIICAVILVLFGLGLSEIRLPGISIQLGTLLSIIASILVIVWLINLYNFMDGMDGLASGMAVFGFSTMAIMGLTAGHIEFLIGSLIIATANAGFLVFNYPPAKIFMGDIGSSTIGLLAAGFIIWAEKENIFPLWIGLLIFSPFILDSTVTLIKRIIRGEKFWKPHKTHYYQILVEAGWGHLKTLKAEYVVMAICCIIALFLKDAVGAVQIVGIALTILMYVFIAYFVENINKTL